MRRSSSDVLAEYPASIMNGGQAMSVRFKSSRRHTAPTSGRRTRDQTELSTSSRPLGTPKLGVTPELGHPEDLVDVLGGL